MADSGFNSKEQEIIRKLTLQVGAPQAESVVRQMRQLYGVTDQVSNSFGKAQKSSQGFFGALQSSHGVLSSVLGLLGGLGTMFGTGFGIAHALRWSNEWKKSLIEGRSLFVKYGVGIDQLERKIESLSEKFKFGRLETLKLAKQFETGFSFQGPEKMDRYFRILANTVGENADAIDNLMQKLQGMSKSMPELEYMVGNVGTSKGQSDLAEYAKSLALGGEIDTGQMKELLNLTESNRTAAHGITEEDKKRKDALNDDVKAVREVQKLFEDVNNALADKIFPWFKKIAGELDHWKSVLTSVLPTALLIASALTAVTTVRGISKITGMAFGGGGMKGGAMGGLASIAVGGAGGGIPVVLVGVAPGALRMMPRVGKLLAQGEVGVAAEIATKSSFARTMTAGAVAIPAIAGLAGNWLGNKAYDAGDERRIDRQSKAEGGTVAKAGFGIAGGAAAGALAGSFVPILGTAVGAAIGATAAGMTQIASVCADILRITGDTDKLLDEQKIKWDDYTRKIKESGDEIKNSMIGKVNETRKAEEELFARQKSRTGFFGTIGAMAGTFLQGKNVSEVDKYHDEEDAPLKERIRYLQAQQEKQRRSAVSQGKMTPGANDSEELKKQYEENKKITDEKEKQKKEVEANTRTLIRELAEQALIRRSIEQQNALLQEQTRFYDQTLTMLSQGGFMAAGSFEKSNEQLGATLDMIQTQIQQQEVLASNNRRIREQNISGLNDEEKAKYDQLLIDFQSAKTEEERENLTRQYTTSIVKSVQAQLTEKKAMADIVTLRNQESQLIKQSTSRFDERIKFQEAETSLLESQVALADNLAMGVAASAQMRMNVVRQISNVIEENRNKLLLIQQAEVRAGDMRKQGLLSEAQYADVLLQKEIERKQVQTTITQSIQKQAEITRVLRDGWINAINAMNNGVGMFTKIKIDRETRLGTLMSRAPKPVVGIATGFAGPGLRRSTSYSALAPGVLENPNQGGRAFGAGSDAWAKAIDKRMPLGMQSNGSLDPEQMSHGFTLWQELIGRHLNTAAAGAGAAPFGVGGLLDEIDPNKPKLIRVNEPLPVKLSGGPISSLMAGVDGALNTVVRDRPDAQPVEIKLSDKQMQDLTDNLVKEFESAFRGVASAAMTRVVEDIENGV